MPGSPFWRAVRELRLSLPEVFYATMARPGDGGRTGVVSEVSAAAAAQFLVDGTLRLSTPDEIRRYLAEQDRQRTLAGVREDALSGRFRFSECEATVRCEAAAVGPTKGKH